MSKEDETTIDSMNNDEKMKELQKQVFPAGFPGKLIAALSVSQLGVITSVLEELKRMEKIQELNLPDDCQYLTMIDPTSEDQFMQFYFYTISEEGVNMLSAATEKVNEFSN